MPDASELLDIPSGLFPWLLTLGGLLHTNQVEAAASSSMAKPRTHEALLVLREALSDPLGGSPRRSLLYADSQSEGILIVHRNANTLWSVWAWKQGSNGLLRRHGHRGEVLHIKENNFIRWVAKDADAAMNTMKRVLLAPDVQLAGCTW